MPTGTKTRSRSPPASKLPGACSPAAPAWAGAAPSVVSPPRGTWPAARRLGGHLHSAAAPCGTTDHPSCGARAYAPMARIRPQRPPCAHRPRRVFERHLLGGEETRPGCSPCCCGSSSRTPRIFGSSPASPPAGPGSRRTWYAAAGRRSCQPVAGAEVHVRIEGRHDLARIHMHLAHHRQARHLLALHLLVHCGQHAGRSPAGRLTPAGASV